MKHLTRNNHPATAAILVLLLVLVVTAAGMYSTCMHKMPSFILHMCLDAYISYMYRRCTYLPAPERHVSRELLQQLLLRLCMQTRKRRQRWRPLLRLPLLNACALRYARPDNICFFLGKSPHLNFIQKPKHYIMVFSISKGRKIFITPSLSHQGCITWMKVSYTRGVSTVMIQVYSCCLAAASSYSSLSAERGLISVLLHSAHADVSCTQ